MPTHLRPTAPIAPDAVLTGDPKRAMELAAALFVQPLMSNLSRGLWGYLGKTHDGALTVQSTGIGGPSAAVVVADLAELGVRRAIRVGACAALDAEVSPGATLVVDSALAADGVGSAFALDGPLRPDSELSARLERATSWPAAPVVSCDLYDHPDPEERRRWEAAGALAVDLSSAAVLAVGRRTGLHVACALVVAESASGDRLEDADLDAALLAAGRTAAEALAY